MKIGEIAARSGLPASTIRYYERVGLLDPPQRISGRRVFDDSALFALRFIKLAQTAGFSIRETKSLLRAYADDPGPGGTWTSLAARKREAVREKMQKLAQIDSVLSELMSCRCKSLTECVEKAIARRTNKRRVRR